MLNKAWRISMSFINNYISKKLKKTQKEFSRHIGKPQSIISRIESSAMNVTVRLLDKIVTAQ